MLALREFHAEQGAVFTELQSMEAVAHYGDVAAEYAALNQSVGLIDLSFRGRLCLLGADRVRLLHGQVTNDIKALQAGQGCYAAFTSPKGRMQADVHVYALAEELLLDFEPGLTQSLIERLDHYIVSDDVQAVDVAEHYGLFSLQGPRALEVPGLLDAGLTMAPLSHGIVHRPDPELGDLYWVNHARTGSQGVDVFVPTAAMGMVWDKLCLAVRSLGGRPVGGSALELARIEAGIPRFGVDMDESHLPPEAGLDRNGISYTKGCYIGQETIARIRTYGQVTKALRGLRFDPGAPMPVRGDKVFHNGREVGSLTSVILSPRLGCPIALGYVRKECNALGTALVVRSASGAEIPAVIVPLPFAV
jgi:folate-binding protein YgfZ